MAAQGPCKGFLSGFAPKEVSLRKHVAEIRPGNQITKVLLTVGACKIKKQVIYVLIPRGKDQGTAATEPTTSNNANASVSDVLGSFIIFWAPAFLGSQRHFSSSVCITAHNAGPDRLRLMGHHTVTVRGGCSTVLASLISRGLPCTFTSPGLSSETQTLTHGAKPQLLSMLPPILQRSCHPNQQQVGNSYTLPSSAASLGYSLGPFWTTASVSCR